MAWSRGGSSLHKLGAQLIKILFLSHQLLCYACVWWQAAESHFDNNNRDRRAKHRVQQFMNNGFEIKVCVYCVCVWRERNSV